MKKIFALMLSMTVILSGLSVFAQSEVTVNFNGEKMTFDVNPFIEEDRTLVPVRAIYETAAKAAVNWDGETKTVIVVYGEGDAQKFIVMQIGNSTAFVNGEAVELEAPAKIVEDITFVPLSFFMNEFGNSISWNADTYTVDITAN